MIIVTEGVDSSWVLQRLFLGLILFSILSNAKKHKISIDKVGRWHKDGEDDKKWVWEVTEYEQTICASV